MKISKIVITAILGLSLATPMMAGGKTSENLIKSAKKWDVKGISAKDLKKKIDKEDDLWMLDVREPYMRGEGSIEGMDNEAISLGTLIFDAETKLEDKNALIIVYCRQGKSAVLAAQMLVKQMHYKNVFYLEGGLESWLLDGNSIFNDLGELKLVTE